MSSITNVGTASNSKIRGCRGRFTAQKGTHRHSPHIHIRGGCLCLTRCLCLVRPGNCCLKPTVTETCLVQLSRRSLAWPAIQRSLPFAVHQSRSGRRQFWADLLNLRMFANICGLCLRLFACYIQCLSGVGIVWIVSQYFAQFHNPILPSAEPAECERVV